jgi:hypothetical protein
LRTTVRATHLDLLGLLLLLFSLGLGDGGEAGLLPDSGGLVPPGGDGGEVGTDDTTLVLHGLAGALLGNLLSDTLLVHATVDDGPGDLAGVLALEEEGGIFGGGEAEHLVDERKWSSLCTIPRRRVGRTLLSPLTNSLPLEG